MNDLKGFSLYLVLRLGYHRNPLRINCLRKYFGERIKIFFFFFSLSDKLTNDKGMRSPVIFEKPLFSFCAFYDPDCTLNAIKNLGNIALYDFIKYNPESMLST